MGRKNKVPWIAGGVLVALFIIGGVVVGTKKKSKTVPVVPADTARALVASTPVARTVIVPPCDTPIEQTTSSAARGQSPPGATAIQLPKGSGFRTVLVPHCQPQTGSTNLSGDFPSAAFVLGGSDRPTEGTGGIVAENGGVAARSQLILPESSTAKTIVVPGCEKKPKKEAAQAALKPARGGSVVVAPAC